MATATMTTPPSSRPMCGRPGAAQPEPLPGENRPPPAPPSPRSAVIPSQATEQHRQTEGNTGERSGELPSAPACYPLKPTPAP